MNDKSLKTYNRWKSFKWLINMGVSCFDFFGKKYDERKVTAQQEADAIVKLKYFKQISSQNSVVALCTLSEYLKKNGWTWIADPLKGYFDYKSKPLMTVAKKNGDCDDFATFWCSLFPSLNRYAIFSDDAKDGHVVACGKLIGSDNFVIVSNLELLGSYTVATEKEAILMLERDWYHDSKKIHCIMEYSKKGYIDKIMVYPF